MSLELIKHREPLNREELSFLRRKEERERKQLFKIVRVFLILCFVCPFVVSWFRAVEGVENPFSYYYYFGGVFFLICFSGAGIYWGYYHNLRKVQLDIHYGTKTIERTLITRKQYMPLNHAYFFYLSSPNKLSIEVNEFDYGRLHNGDEVSIEYTTYAKLYLGYF
jgi:hypothetical protein